ncbi:MAG TPA: hypothetical protein VEB00_12780 [Clostridia bacterium]|nr:hypothetical protein [Clostridia bacterium]
MKITVKIFDKHHCHAKYNKMNIYDTFELDGEYSGIGSVKKMFKVREG